jgi:hypothetical protein
MQEQRDMIKTPDDGLRLELFSQFYTRMKLGVSPKVKTGIDSV